MKISKIKATFIKFILFILGLFMISYFIWIRFLRARIPRDIPFTLNLYGFLILLYICCIYVYIIYIILFNNKVNSKFIYSIVSYLYKPLIMFDQTIKNYTIIKPYYEKILSYLISKLKKLMTLKEGHSYYRLYIIIQILPRAILVAALLIDIFYFYSIRLY